MHKVWSVQTESHAFLSMLLTLILHSWFDHYNYALLSMLTLHFGNRCVFKTKKFTLNIYIVGLVLIAMRMSYLIPVISILTLALEQDILKPQTKLMVLAFHNTVTNAIKQLPAYNNPTFGANSFSSWYILTDIMSTLRELCSNEINKFMYVERRTEARWLRDHGISPVPLRIADRPPVPATLIKQTVAETTSRYRTAAVVFGFCLTSYLLRSPPLLLAGIFVYMYSLTETKMHKLFLNTRGSPMKEGVYSINNEILGFSTSHGVGVVFNGVMHIPYHVCSGRPIRIGNTLYNPYYINSSADLVTYNGPSQIRAPDNLSQVYVNCETVLSRTSYQVDIDVDRVSQFITWHGVTQPGESGSPVYAHDANGTIMLVGLAGRYYRSADGEVTEYTESNEAPLVSENRYQRHIYHPGYGKTRKVIPRIIISHLMANPHGKVILTGPTRVVCRELYDALKHQFNVSLIIKDSPGLKNRHAQIQIGAHATIMKMILQGDVCVRGATCLAIDEAHFNDSSTHMLRTYGKWMLTQGHELHELSATLDGEYANGSNYHIDEKKITALTISSTIAEELGNGSRVLVFVPSIKSASAILGTFKKYNPIILSRPTFTKAVEELQDLERRLIVSTDIAECGINIPDLSVVVDFGQKFDYFCDNNIIYSRTAVINMASYIQRRGRVGRVKEGKYYYVYSPIEYHSKTVAEIDAEIIMTGREWSMNQTNGFDICLTEKQVLTMFDRGETPTYTFLVRRSEGSTHSSDDRALILDSLRHGANLPINAGCEDRSCPCAGGWKWFDYRIHDYMVRREAPPPIVEL